MAASEIKRLEICFLKSLTKIGYHHTKMLGNIKQQPISGVVKNLMVKTPAEPDLANRRATEMMQRMKTVETLGADKEALYKEGYRGGLSSGLHDTFDNIKREQRSCDEGVDSLNKRLVTNFAV